MDIYNILSVRWIDGCVNSSISNILVSGFSKGIQHLSMKQGSLFVLFCTYKIHRTGMLQITFLVSLESSRGGGGGGGGVHLLGFMAFGLVVQKFLNIE
jgi:hypothetical protein